MGISPEDSVRPQSGCLFEQTTGDGGLVAAVQDSGVLLGVGGRLPLVCVDAHGAQVLENSQLLFPAD